MSAGTANVLILSTAAALPGIAQFPRTLVQAGFNVGAVAPSASLLARSRHLTIAAKLRGTVDPASVVDALAGVLRAWPYHLIIPGDDWGVRFLNQIAEHCEAGEITGPLADAVRRSVVAPPLRRIVERKSLQLDLAAGLGIRIAPQLRPDGPDAVRDFCARHGLPVLVKSEVSASGGGVFIADSVERAVAAAMGNPPPGIRSPWDRDIVTVQRFIRGASASVTFSSHQGRLLAGFCYVAEYCDPPGVGSATVIRVIDRPDLVAIAERIVRQLGFTGFAGLDFILEEGTGLPWLLEMNPRPPQTAHLASVVGVDVCGTFRAALAGDPAPPAGTPRPDTLVALFPAEWARDPSSPYLATAHHPVPWDDRELLAAIIDRVLHQNRPPTGRAPAELSFLMTPQV